MEIDGAECAEAQSVTAIGIGSIAWLGRLRSLGFMRKKGSGIFWETVGLPGLLRDWARTKSEEAKWRASRGDSVTKNNASSSQGFWSLAGGTVSIK